MIPAWPPPPPPPFRICILFLLLLGASPPPSQSPTLLCFTLVAQSLMLHPYLYGPVRFLHSWYQCWIRPITFWASFLVTQAQEPFNSPHIKHLIEPVSRQSPMMHAATRIWTSNHCLNLAKMLLLLLLLFLFLYFSEKNIRVANLQFCPTLKKTYLKTWKEKLKNGAKVYMQNEKQALEQTRAGTPQLVFGPRCWIQRPPHLQFLVKFHVSVKKIQWTWRFECVKTF